MKPCAIEQALKEFIPFGYEHYALAPNLNKRGKNKSVLLMIHCVRQPAPAPAQQYFPLTPLQPPAPAPASPTVFFSHTIPAPASSSSLPNADPTNVLQTAWY